MTMRKVLAVSVTLALALAACSTKSSSSPQASTQASMPSAPRSTASHRTVGVTADTVRVGVTYPDFDAIRKIVNIDQGNFKEAYTALFDQINAAGGIHGRKIVPYFAPINPIGTDPAAVACTQLTEDNKVFVAMGFFQHDDPLCYVSTHDTPVLGVGLTAAQQAQAKAPWFSGLTPEHTVPKVLAAAAERGAFSGQKVAVVAQSGDAEQMNDLVLPALRKLKVNVVQSAVQDAPASDTSAGFQRYALIARKFQSLNATVVVAVGQAGNGWPKSLQVNKSSYHPVLVATDQGSLQSYVADKTGNDPAVLTGALTAGTNPPESVIWNDPPVRDCVQTVQKAYPNGKIGNPLTASASTPTTWVAVESACGTVALLKAILTKAGQNLDNESFLTGGESLGAFRSPGIPQPLHYGPSSHDGDGPVFLSTYDSATRELVTQSKPSG
jgi:ABC-type branched-subunit amino acid transport system substrate-binding protein